MATGPGIPIPDEGGIPIPEEPNPLDAVYADPAGSVQRGMVRARTMPQPKPGDINIGGRDGLALPGAQEPGGIPIPEEGLETAPLDEGSQLAAIMSAARMSGLDNAARAAKVSEITGIPANIVKHRLPEWEARMQQSLWDPEKFQIEQRALANLLLRKPQLAPSFIKDQEAASGVERFLRGVGGWLSGAMALDLIKNATDIPEDMGRAWEQSKLQARLEKIAHKQWLAALGQGPQPTAAELAEADELEMESAFVQALRPEMGFFSGMPGGAVEQLKRQIDNASEIAYYANQGGVLGAGVGAAAGVWGAGVGALPGAAGGYLTGLGVGMKAGIYQTTLRSEGALFFRQMVKDGVDPKDAAQAAFYVGAASGVLEFLPLERVLRIKAGVKAVAKGPTQDLVREYFAKPSVASALVRAGVRLGEGAAFEGLTEGGQQAVQVGAGAYLQTHDVTKSLAALWDERVQIWEATYKGAQAAGGMTMMSPFNALEIYSDLREATTAKQRIKLWEGLSDDLKNSQLAKDNPAALVELVKEARRVYGGSKTVSIPVEALRPFFAGEGMDQDAIAALLPDVARQLDSPTLDGEVVLKTEDLISKLVPLAGFKTLTQDIRVGEGPTARELPEVEKAAETLLKDVEEREKQKTAGGDEPLRRDLIVYDAVRKSLLGLDMAPEEASKDAALWAAFANSRATRRGEDPVEYFKKLNVVFRREETIKASMKNKKNVLDLYQRDDPRLSGHQKELYAEAMEAATPEAREAALEELIESLLTDELTGARSQKEWQTFAPKDAFGNYIATQPGWYLAMDVNDLKRINDTLGHAAGDAMLAALGQALGKSIRDRRGKFFRSGGDEFMAHFQTQAQAESAIKAITAAVNGLPFMFDGAHKASISVGMGRDPGRADLAGMKAKEQARKMGRSGFGREGAAEQVVLDLGDVFTEIDLSLMEEDKEVLFQAQEIGPAGGEYGEVVHGVDPKLLEDDQIYAAFKLPDGRIAITGAVHDISGLPEDVQKEFFSDPDWYDKASRKNVPGALVHGRALRTGRFWASHDIDTLSLFQRAFHGSPYTFDQFTLKHLGTGEGAQAFGWGLYFAERRTVAQYYKEEGARARGKPERLAYDGRDVEDIDIIAEADLRDALDMLRDGQSWSGLIQGAITPEQAVEMEINDRRDVVRRYEDRIASLERKRNPKKMYGPYSVLERQLTRVRGYVEKANKAIEKLVTLDPSKITVLDAEYAEGKGYEVEIPDSDVLLDYDKPMSAQPVEVLRRLAEGGIIHPKFMEYVKAGQEVEALADQFREGEQTQETQGRLDAARAKENVLRAEVYGAHKHPLDAAYAAPDKYLRILPGDTGWTFYQKLARIEADKAGLPDHVRNRGERQASERLLLADIQGLQFLDGASRADGTGTHNFVIWDEKAIKILDTWDQIQNAQVRGKFSTTKARDYFEITLSGKANLSTFLHESGHAFMAILERDAAGGDKQAQEEIDHIRHWLGIEGRRAPTRAEYESFARGFEAYLREGQAPSTRLAEVFETFKAWLRHIYSTVFRLNVTLDPEITGVMDRLLATDMEIKEAQQKLHLVPLEDPTGAMPHEEYQDYRTRFAAALRDADQVATKASLYEFNRAVSDERRQLEREIDRVSLEDPFFNARELILKGKRLSGEVGTAALMVAGRKLDREAMAGLPLDKAGKARLYAVTEEGGLDPDFVAKALQIEDGKTLLMGLASLPSREVWVRLETDRRMSEKYPGYQNNRAWNAMNAHRALHHRKVGDALWAGYVALGKKLGGKAGKSAKMAIDAAARRRVEEATVLEFRPHLAMRAEAKAAREVAEAWRAGDIRQAFDATRRQLFHHSVARQMLEAREEVEKITKHFASFKDPAKRKRLGKGNFAFLQAIDQVLARIEYGETLERGDALADTLSELRTLGYPILLPADFNLDTLRGDYEAMTLGQLRMVQSVVKNLEHIALTEARELIKGQKLDWQGLTSELALRIRSNLGKTLPSEAPDGGLIQVNPTGWQKFKADIRSAYWHLKKMEFATRIMDAGETAGFAHQHLYQGIADAEAHEHTLMREIFTKLRQEFTRLPFMERMRHDRKVEFLGTTIARRDLLMIAGHLRNPGNRDRLVRDWGWDPQAIIKRLDDLLTEEDVATINGIGDLMESLWPQVVEVYRRFYGVEPPKVTGKDIVLPNKGVIKGGYFPIIRDPDRDSGPDPFAGDLWDEGYINAMVGHGFTEARSKKANTKMWLSLDALPGHFTRVIHFITHFEATHRTNRLLRDPGVASAIKDTLSNEAYKEMVSWIQGVVKGGETGAEIVSGFDKYLRYTRSGATIVIMGARLATAVIQGMGLTMTAKELSMKNGKASIFSKDAAKYMALGAWQVVEDMGKWIKGEGLSPFKQIEAVNDHWILHRENYERDLRLEYKRLTSALAEVGHARKRIAEFSMALFNLVQGTVNAITWHAALRKAQDEGHERPADYANSVIRMSQSAGGPKDLAGIQRGSEFKRWATVLYSFANVVFNATTEQSPQHLSTTQNVANRAAQLWWVILAPAIIAVLVRGDPEDLEDPEAFVKATGLESLTFGARSIPIAGDVARGVAHGYAGKPAPWLDLLYRAAQTAHKAPGVITGEKELTETDYQNMLRAAGMGLHLPTQGVWNMIQYFNELPTMEDELLNAAFRSEREWR